MKTKTVGITNLSDQQLSWLLAKHLYPNDEPIKQPELATDGSGYNFMDADQEMTFEILNAIEKYKVSVIWRPWIGDEGQWWACVEDDPISEEVLGVLHTDRTRAIVLALVAHLEDAKDSLQAELPEVLCD